MVVLGMAVQYLMNSLARLAQNIKDLTVKKFAVMVLNTVVNIGTILIKINVMMEIKGTVMDVITNVY